MKKKVVVGTALISFIITCITPYIFDVYLASKPTSKIISFGGPFPFLSNEITLSQDIKFPLKLDFHINQLQHATFHYISFLFSFIGIFLLLISILATLLRFFKKEHRI
jgi:hypothetical protein